MSLAWAQDLDKLMSIFPVQEIDQGLEFSKTPEEMQKFFTDMFYNEKNILKVSFEPVELLDNGAVAKFSYANNKGMREIKLYYTEAFLTSQSAYLDAYRFGGKLNNLNASIIELMANAGKKSNESLATLAIMRGNLEDGFYNPLFNNLAEEKKTLFKNHVNQQFLQLEDKYVKAAKKDMKLAKEKLDIKAQKWDDLDNAEKQLKDMISQGKRKEAVKLLKAYLPLEIMNPVERAQWVIWLDAMENPVAMKDRMIILRGLEKGQFFKAADESLFLMGPLLIKNQGSYNRRLRSLKTMLMDKPISNAISGKNGDIQSLSMRLANQYRFHAGQPLGSPYISFTINPTTAHGFSREGIGIFAMDPRLVTLSPHSYAGEFEHLVTLFTFPDDNIGFIPQAELPPYGKDNLGILNQKIQTTIETKVGKKDAAKMLAKSDLKTGLLVERPADFAKNFFTRASEQFMKLVESVYPGCNKHFDP